MNAIEVSGLRKSYGAREVLHGVDFSVEAGEVFALLGPNGAGKTICTAWTYSNFIDLKVGNCGSADVLDFSAASNAINCEIHTASGFGVDCGADTIILGCWFHDMTGTQVIDANTAGKVFYCYIDCAVTGTVIDNAAYMMVIGNIIDLSGGDTSVIGISAGSDSMIVIANTIYCSNANTSQGISVNAYGAVILNNIIEGWSGSGGDGIETSGFNSCVGANAVYNCNAAYTITAAKLNYAIAPNDTLVGASPFTNASTLSLPVVLLLPGNETKSS